MCGRFTLSARPAEIAALFDLPDVGDFPPRFNIAPTQPILVVLGGRDARPDSYSDTREALLARWGLIPSWVKDARGFPLLFNARSETAATKGAFRAAMRHRRCLIPASGFYEWRKGPGRRSTPFHLAPASGEPFAFAGLMETAHGPDGGEVDTAAILTTAANAELSAIHERMPVVVRREDHARWLDCRAAGPQDVADILSARKDGFFEAREITDRINRAGYTSPDVLAPAAGTSPEPAAPAPKSASPRPQRDLFDDP